MPPQLLLPGESPPIINRLSRIDNRGSEDTMAGGGRGKIVTSHTHNSRIFRCLRAL